jgi:hypothetical protein
VYLLAEYFAVSLKKSSRIIPDDGAHEIKCGVIRIIPPDRARDDHPAFSAVAQQHIRIDLGGEQRDNR